MQGCAPGAPADEAMSKHIFSTDRQKRIDRREERNFFRRRLLPLAWVLAVLGVVGLAVCYSSYLIHGEWPYSVAGLFVALVAFPFVLIAIGWLRGHGNYRLEEP